MRIKSIFSDLTCFHHFKFGAFFEAKRNQNKNMENIKAKDLWIKDLPKWRDKFCDATIHASNLQTIEKTKVVTKISFSKISSKVPIAHPFHRFILAGVGNDFLKLILSQIEDEELHIFMPDFSRQEIDTFFRFVYGQIDEIDKNSPICKLFLNENFYEQEIEAQKEEEIEDSPMDIIDTHYSDSDYEIPEEPPKKVQKKIKTTPKSKPKDYSKKLSEIDEAMDWNCSLCPESQNLYKFSEYDNHMKKEHHNDQKTGFTCEKCGRNYEVKDELLVHCTNENCQISKVDKVIKCQYCPCKFFHFKNLQSHVSLHHSSTCKVDLGLKWNTYFCEFCLKLFQTATNYRNHIENYHNFRSCQEDFQNISEEVKEIQDSKVINFMPFCRKCQKKFQNRKEYRQHFPKDHKSDFLSAKTGTYGLFTQNMGFSYEPDFPEISQNLFCYCKPCSLPFKIRSGFLQHVKQVHEVENEQIHGTENSIFCKYCNGSFLTRQLFIKHQQTCNSRTFACDMCDLKFLNEGRLKTHKIVTHFGGLENASRPIHEKVLENGKIRYKCEICGKLLNSNKAVYHHKDVIHNLVSEKFKCPEEGCHYEATKENYMKRHMNNVHGEKKHVCDRCGKKFTTAYEVRVHIKRAHLIEEHPCQECGKVFKNKYTLMYHKREHKEARKSCEKCGKKFVHNDSLRHHMTFAHSDIRRFLCDCGKGFKLKSHLQRHWKTSGHGSGQIYDRDMENFTRCYDNPEQKPEDFVECQ